MLIHVYIYLLLDLAAPFPTYEKTEWEIYLFGYVDITPTFVTKVDYCSISPQLNLQGLNFDENTGSIKGTLTLDGESQLYTVTCVNGFGTSSANLNITVIGVTAEEGCRREGNAYINITVFTYTSPSRMGFSMLNSLGHEIISKTQSEEGWASRKQYDYTMCVPAGVYKFIRTSTTSGWERQAISIDLFGTVIANYSMDTIHPTTVESQLYCIIIIIISKK